MVEYKQKIDYLDRPFLYLDKTKKLTNDWDEHYYNTDIFKEVSAYDFIASQGEQGWLPKYGEEVEFSNDGENWNKDVFIGYLPNINCNFWCNSANYRYCRPLKQTKTITIDGKDIVISLEVYNKLIKQFIEK